MLEQAGFPPEWWPFAVMHFCFASNIAIVDCDSAWNKRHRNGHFKGLRVPFGSLIDFIPSPPPQSSKAAREKAKLPKFA